MAHAYRCAKHVDRGGTPRSRPIAQEEAATDRKEQAEKLVIIVTHGPDEAELATIPFVVATGALASEMDVFMAFQGEGVRLITKGGVDDVHAEAFPPLAELVATIGEFGGLLAPCSPCLENRDISEDDLLDGVEVIGAARLVAEIASATATLNY